MNSSTSRVDADHGQFAVLWTDAVERYKKDTGDSLPDLTKWASVDTDAVVSLLDASQTAFEDYRTKGNSVRKHLKPLLEFVKAFSDVAKEAVGEAFPPAAVIFAGINHLFESSDGVSENYDAISDALELVSGYVSRLKVLTHRQLGDELVSIVIKSLVQVLALLNVTNNAIKKGRSRAFLKKLVGRTDDIEPIVKEFEKLFKEEDRMLLALIYDDSRTRKLNEISEFLKYPYPNLIHEQARKRHQRGTGLWIVEDSRYCQWRDTSGKAMWIHGLPGTGKTLLFSSLVEDLRSRFRVTSEYQTRNNCGVAYFYCTVRDQSTLTLHNILGSLLMQLVYQRPHIPSCITILHEKRHEGPPTISALVSALQDIAVLFEHTYVLIDALDECSEDTKSDLPNRLTEISLSLQDHIHLLVTSRPDSDLSLGSGSIATLEFDLDLGSKRDIISGDIASYLRHTLDSDRSFSKWDKDTRRSVEDVLIKNANGMFLWVRCQLDTLKGCRSLAVIKKALDNLPKDLYETYDHILASVPPEHFRDVYLTLQWLVFARSPLGLDELCDALIVDLSSPEKSCISPEHRLLQPELLLDICSSLVTLEHNNVNLSHASVKDYLLSRKISRDITSLYDDTGLLPFEPSVSERFLASSCLVSLVRLEKGNNKLQRYAHHYWSAHLYNGGGVDKFLMNILPLLQSYFSDSKPLFSTLALLQHMEACIFYHRDEIMMFLLSQDCVSLDQGIDYNIVLHYAVGHTDRHTGGIQSDNSYKPALLKWALVQGANVDSSMDGMTSIQALSTSGLIPSSSPSSVYSSLPVACARLLLDHHTDPDAGGDKLCSPLCHAVLHSFPSVNFITILLQYGARPMAVHHGNYGSHIIAFRMLRRFHPGIIPSEAPTSTPLHMAAFCGRTLFVKLLLRQVDTNVSCDIGNPLLAALIGAFGSQLHGYHIEYQWLAYWTNFKEYWDCIEILLQHGTDINARYPGISTPLDYATAVVEELGHHSAKAAAEWREEIIANLIKHGACTAEELAEHLPEIPQCVLDSSGEEFTEAEDSPIAAVNSGTDDASASLQIPADPLSVHDLPGGQASARDQSPDTDAAEEISDEDKLHELPADTPLVQDVLDSERGNPAREQIGKDEPRAALADAFATHGHTTVQKDFQKVDGQGPALEGFDDTSRATRAAEGTREWINIPVISREVVLVGLVTLVIGILLGSLRGGT